MAELVIRPDPLTLVGRKGKAMAEKQGADTLDLALIGAIRRIADGSFSGFSEDGLTRYMSWQNGTLIRRTYPDANSTNFLTNTTKPAKNTHNF